MRTDNRVLYFSLNSQSVKSFYEFLDSTRLDSQCSFRAIDREDIFDKDNGNALKFKHAADLLYFLDSFSDKGDLGYLYVIIDYPSFFNPKKHCTFVEQEKTNELESFSVKDAAKIIRRAILQYPEVFFMFDESWSSPDTPPFFPSFLFYFNANKYVSGVWTEYHKYAIRSGENPFDAILRGRTSMFDSSNLRYAIKRYEYDVLNVERYNFSLIQDERAKKLALCIEEERAQNRFNSYVLYANGYRVLPVFSSKELAYINENASVLNPSLIVRDYDLQFPDVEDNATLISISTKESYLIHTIDYIRGGKYLTKNDNKWAKTHPKDEQPKDEELDYHNKWFVPTPNHYWDNLLKVDNIEVYFVSKGVGDGILHFSPSALVCQKRRKRELNKAKKSETVSLNLFVDGLNCQFMRGTTKPVSGIYTVFRQFKTIKDHYDSFRIVNKRHFQKEHPIGESDKDQRWFIDTNRKNHDHGVPLDIYDTVRNMLERARRYYNNGKYIRSAIISSEVIEILNGFHEALVLQAYHVLAISENAIAMNTIGGNEEELSLDANFRISKIASEVERLMDRNGEDRRKFKYNILNQIYSECRAFCQEKEHFEAENRFISAMAHVNEGYAYKDIYREMKNVVDKWIGKVQQFIRVLRNA